MASQTEWKHPKNANTQYKYREFTEEQQKEEFAKEELSKFVDSATTKFEEALQQNEIMNVFYDDWNALSSGGSLYHNARYKLRYSNLIY